MARVGAASAPAPVCSVLGRSDPWPHLGGLAHSFLPDQRDAASRVVGLGPYFLGIVTLSVIITPLFNVSRGSLLIAVLYHFQMMNPLWPDAQPYDSFILSVLLSSSSGSNRNRLFQRKRRSRMCSWQTAAPVNR